MKKIKFLLAVCILYTVFCRAQENQFQYKRSITGITDTWHKIEIPDSLYQRLNANLTDLRIYGVTKNGDTIEAPYFIQDLAPKSTDKSILFQQLNTAHTAKGFYYTFQIENETPINKIELQISDSNFDWHIQLEGSNDQNEWFTLLDDYRILGIENEQTQFKYSELNFSSAKYTYYRLCIKTKKKPHLNGATLLSSDEIKGTYRNYMPHKVMTANNKRTKQTTIIASLPITVPINYLDLQISDTTDYYRPITIDGVTDSTKTENGWHYSYKNLYSGTLNSVTKKPFTFNGFKTNQLKIEISNNDNQPLRISGIEAKGTVKQLVARFSEPATYFLAYTKSNTAAPNYDIKMFLPQIPTKLKALQLGNEEVITTPLDKETHALFENKLWLWAVMIVIALVLGWFSFKMLKKS